MTIVFFRESRHQYGKIEFPLKKTRIKKYLRKMINKDC